MATLGDNYILKMFDFNNFRSNIIEPNRLIDRINLFESFSNFDSDRLTNFLSLSEPVNPNILMSEISSVLTVKNSADNTINCLIVNCYF